MRTLILTLTATAALGLATAAAAQQSVNGPNQMPNIPQGSGGSFGMNIHEGEASGYEAAVMRLKLKVDRVTHEDGGQLTSEHLASLQGELDALNRQYGRKPQVPRRASFGHHQPAPGGSSATS